MIVYKNLQIAIAQVIKQLTSKTVFWSNQNANTPDGDYLALRISSMRFVGATDYESKPDEDGKATTQGDREIVLSIQAISQSAMEILLDLVNKLNLNSNLALLSSKRLAYVGLDGAINDITVQIDKSFETRATVELIFRISKNYSSATEDELDIVESVETSGELSGNGLVDPVEIDLTVTTGE